MKMKVCLTKCKFLTRRHDFKAPLDTTKKKRPPTGTPECEFLMRRHDFKAPLEKQGTISRHHSSETSVKVLKKTAQREKQRRRQDDQARRDLVESCLLIRNSHLGASKGPLEIIALEYEFTL